MPNQSAAYCDALYTAAVQLSQQQTKLSQENRQLGTASSYFDFISEILSNIDSASNITEIAERFAVGWQKFYQTGPVCLYLTALSDSQFPAVTVDSMAESKVAYLIPPAGVSAIPEAMENKFAILNAQDCVEWLFEQIDTDFNLSYTKIIPLLCSNKAIGALVFELRYPTDTELFIEDFKAVVSIAATVLDIASDRRNQQGFAERFADLLSGPEKIQPQTEPAAAIAEEKKEIIEEDKTLSALAEMAGGAAHELNNPLSVISGRAQFLAGSESNPEKKRMLKQIQENANELAWIIDGLMTFARPQPPRTEQINIKQILDEAVQLAAQKNGKDKLDIEIDIAGESKDVFVDSAQIVSAIANIFTNALESYADGFGPIKVNAKPDESGDFINVQISDFGCGMDAETLERAALPFFSVKPAGRKRGMGLAHAKRFIQLNKGLLKITSQAGKGTTVIVSLPCK